MAKLPLKILTPYGKYLEKDVDFVLVNCLDSQLGILPNHTDLISPITVSCLEISDNNSRTKYAVGGGILKIENKVCTLLLNSIESQDEIDLNRAEQSKLRAETRLADKKDIDIERAKLSLARALNRINVKTNR